MNISEAKLAKSSITDTVFVGKVNKKGDRWLEKKDITNDFIAAVISRWNGYKEIIKDSEGNKFEITVKQIK